MSRAPGDPREARPPATLTFLAPAHRCNQRCPACILDQVGEPVRSFDLEPQDYGKFVSDFVEAAIEIRSVIFQGYEVTLPASWPFVEAAFAVAHAHQIRRGFITNGMLLAKWTDRILALNPYRIAVSLDGSTATVNDRYRGLPGAFNAVLSNIREFFRRAPAFRERLSIASCLYGEEGYRSLLEMPSVLVDLGISSWSVSAELSTGPPGVVPVARKTQLVRWLEQLREAAERVDLDFHVSDEFHYFSGDDAARIRARHVSSLDTLYRLDPSGHVRRGDELTQLWGRARRWNPQSDDAPVTCEHPL